MRNGVKSVLCVMAGAVVGGALMGGCTAGSGDSAQGEAVSTLSSVAPEPVMNVSESTPTVWEVSNVSAPGTLDEAGEQASLLVTGEVVDVEPFEFSGLPYSRATVEVASVRSATGVEAPMVGGEVIVRQLGEDENVAENLANVLTEGGVYALMLRPFTFSDGADTGEWMIVGDTAAWVESDRQGEFDHVDGGVPLEDADSVAAATLEQIHLGGGS